MAVPGTYSGLVCRYLWKFGSSTARTQKYPLCKVVPGPVVLPVPVDGTVVVAGGVDWAVGAGAVVALMEEGAMVVGATPG